MIKILDSFIADKIAAGEVIERPVSIIKELIENSIDACADSIIVEIRNGGKSYIRVTDSGYGIPANEVELAFERHATSKISGIEDLDNITSLGFRGEALASIAAISRLTIITRTPDSPSGTKLVMHGGHRISTETVGTNTGTTIVIEDVFYNTPARRKFMGTDAREASAIIDLIQQYAICYSETRFMLINNGTTVFTTEGNGDTLDSIRAVYPSKEYSNLIPIYNQTVRGYISDPGITKPSRRGQLFFVNGRLVSSDVIEKGIEKGYNGRIFNGFPIAILFITANPSDLDVNIHPGKREIKFLHQDQIIDAIASAINSVMDTYNSIPATVATNKLKETTSINYTDCDDVEISAPEQIIKNDPVGDLRDYLSEIKRKGNEVYTTNNIQPPLNISDQEIDIIPDEPKKFNFDDMQLKGYVFNTYIILQKDDELYILDQHAAHERIFYEKLMNCYKNTEQIPQSILTPIVLNVSADIYNSDRKWMNTLSIMGYDITDFGPNSFIIRGIPSYMTKNEADNFACSFIEGVDEYSDNNIVIDKLIMKSCKSAVKANEKLSTIEINDLLKKLSLCDNPFCCPHGRPSFVKMSKYEIEKSFKRK